MAYNYAYDGAGNLAAKLDGKGVTSYSYDALNRLQCTANTETTEGDLSGFDPATWDGEYLEYVYDAAGNQREEVGLAELGSEAEAGAALYEYDVWNNLVKTVEGTNTVEMEYNGDGQRVSKESGGSLTRQMYESSRVILEVDGQGNQTAYNMYGTELLKRAAEGQSLLYMYNGHSDVTALMTSSGTIAASYYYDAFGKLTETTGQANNPFRYAGYQYDEENELYYLNSRHYAPDIARFMQEDTYLGDQADPLSLNLYTYCGNNPLIYTDPSGHSRMPLIGASRIGLEIKDTSNSLNSTGRNNKLIKKDEREAILSFATQYVAKSTNELISRRALRDANYNSVQIQKAEKIPVRIKNTTTEGKLIGGTTYVGIRDLGEALGGTVEYDEETNTATITLNGNVVEITTENGQQVVKLNGRVQEDVGCVFDSEWNKNLIPLRAISNLLGVDNSKISWDGDNRVAHVDPQGFLVGNYADNVLGMTSQVTGSKGFSVDAAGYLSYDASLEGAGWKPTSQTAMDVLLAAISSSQRITYTEVQGGFIFAGNATIGTSIVMDADDVTKGVTTTSAGPNGESVSFSVGVSLIHELVHAIRNANGTNYDVPGAPTYAEEAFAVYIQNMVVYEIGISTGTDTSDQLRYDGSNLYTIPGTTLKGNDSYGNFNGYEPEDVEAPTTLDEILAVNTKTWRERGMKK